MTSRRDQPWTDIYDDELRQLLAAAARVARQFGRSPDAIKSRKGKLALHLRVERETRRGT